MKILLAHNFYGSSAPSGENSAYLAELDLLVRSGHEVLEFTRHSDEIRARGPIGTLQGALATPWNPFAVWALRQVLEREQPEILHVHNTFPLLSPAIFRATRGFETASVLTLHNYRCFCAAGIPMHNGTPCTECLDQRSVLPALRRGCYRDSRLATAPLATMIALHRLIGTWQRDVDAFIALTPFQRDHLVKAGLPGDKVHVKPHFYPDPPEPLPWSEREQKVVFVGRLREEKGLYSLVEAWKRWGEEAPGLELIGDGPERESLQNAAGELYAGRKIKFLGQLPFSEGQQVLAGARLLVLPSLCFEGFPMVIREAFALGVPVAASRLGSMPCIVNEGDDGVLFAPGDSGDLLAALKTVWADERRLAAMAKEARKTFEREYTAPVNHKLLMDIYQAATARRIMQKSQ